MRRKQRKTRKVTRSAISGRFVEKRMAKKSPRTTITQRLKGA
jgi:hypothetical protein